MLRPVEKVDAEAPLAVIARLAADGASGELISASEMVEVHVYLLEGRLAWATSSTARNEFMRHLVDAHGIGEDAIREVIAECQRKRKRFGETLVSWGVATLEQVRSALHAQLAEALHALANQRGARTLFLARKMDYARDLTFALAEFGEAARHDDASATAGQLVAQTMNSLPEALWAEVHMHGERVGREARPGAPRPGDGVAELAHALDAGRAEALSLRSAFGTVLGQRLPLPAASLWCAVRQDAKLGVVSSLLAATAGAEVDRVDTPCPQVDEERLVTRADVSVLRQLAPLETALGNVDELCAVLVRHDEDDRHAAVLRRGVPLDQHAAATARWARPLRLTIAPWVARDADAARLLAYDHLSTRVVTGDAVYFGTPVPTARQLSVWLVLRPSAPQGLGWALLSTLARQVGDGVTS